MKNLPRWAWISAVGVGLIVAYIVLKRSGGSGSSDQQQQPSQPTSQDAGGGGAGLAGGGGDTGSTDTGKGTHPVVTTLVEPIQPPPYDPTPWGGPTTLPQYSAFPNLSQYLQPYLWSGQNTSPVVPAWGGQTNLPSLSSVLSSPSIPAAFRFGGGSTPSAPTAMPTRRIGGPQEI